MRPWLVNPAQLIKAARRLRRELRALGTPLPKPEEAFCLAVERYEAAIYRGGPKQKVPQ